jgi:cobalt-zinc-cadmium efflux system outer membrane protein
MKQCLYPFVLLSVAVSGSAFAQATNQATNAETTITALVDDALANNPELGFYRAEIAAAKGEKKTAATISNPNAEFEIGRKRATPVGGGLSGEGTAWAVSVSQTFEWPNRIALRKAIANRQISLAEIGLAQFQRELASQVKRAGFNLLVAQEKRDAARNVAERGEQLIQSLLQREPAGPTPLLEARIIEASILSLKHRANEAAKEAETALLEVNQLRGKSIGTPLRIAPVKLRYPALDEPDAFIALGRTNNFEIKSRVVELEQQGLKVALAKNERYPSFTVKPFYAQETALEKEQAGGVAVSVPVPLWNRNKGNIDAAKSRHEQAETSLIVTQRAVEKVLRENLARYSIDQKEISGWRADLLDQLREAAELADRHYRLGSVPVTTYVEMQEKYLGAVETVLDTQRQALETLGQIERLTGAPIGNVISSEKKSE